MLNGKTVVLGVTGSIAAYKIANLASMLVKLKADVHVIMTRNATNFINPITFETLTNNKCLIETFDRNFSYNVLHVSLAKKADVFLVAPASANVIGKIANGIADDMLTTTFMACTCKKIIAPAMNTNMFQNPVVQDNINKCLYYGYEIIDTESGYLACGDIGEGKLPKEEVLLSYILKEIQCKKDMLGKKVLVTAGPTRENIDPVRFISNNSTGKMGYSIAKAAMLRGANVTLVSGPTNIDKPDFIEVIDVISASDMFDAVIKRSKEMDIIIKAAAVADYTPSEVHFDKVKKSSEDMDIKLDRTKDILLELGKNKKNNQFICGFSMETKDLIENSKAKLEKKNADMIVANNLKVCGAGFGTDTNVVTLITKDNISELSILSKDLVAHKILDEIVIKLSWKTKVYRLLWIRIHTVLYF